MDTFPAQITFLEDESYCFKHGGFGRWHGRLLNPQQAVDTQQGNTPVKQRNCSLPSYTITQTGKERFEAVFQGGAPGSRRYETFFGPKGLTEAQKHAIRWAGRRFRIPVQ